MLIEPHNEHCDSTNLSLTTNAKFYYLPKTLQIGQIIVKLDIYCMG
jgi:hypothetical protein